MFVNIYSTWAVSHVANIELSCVETAAVDGGTLNMPAITEGLDEPSSVARG